MYLIEEIINSKTPYLNSITQNGNLITEILFWSTQFNIQKVIEKAENDNLKKSFSDYSVYNHNKDFLCRIKDY